MHVNNISDYLGSDEGSRRHTADERKTAAVQKDCPRKCTKVVETYFQLVKKLSVAVRQSVVQPIYSTWSLTKIHSYKKTRV